MKNDAMRRRAGGVKLSSIIFCVTVLAAGLPTGGRAQVNSGSNGSDGAFNPTTSTNINMATHPNGIYQYTSVNIPSGVTVNFTPNVNNTPVVWLVQGDVVINGTVDVSGQSEYNYGGPTGSGGGPGGWAGGNGGTFATSGLGLGGGSPAQFGGNGSFGSSGARLTNGAGVQGLPGVCYGNVFLLPLLGGSGGGGSTTGASFGAGGGGAILIASSGTITLNGMIYANGGNTCISGSDGQYNGMVYIGPGAGSGGAVRLVARTVSGGGQVSAAGGSVLVNTGGPWWTLNNAGSGRVRYDVLENKFSGLISGAFTQGFQPIITPVAGQGTQLAVTSVGGVPVSASPSGVLVTPDAVLSAQQNNPIPIVVSCANLPLNTPITVSVRPANGSPVSAVGYNNTGTLASSTATVSLNMSRGGGIIWATAATGN